jgi:hypothetical protein
LRRIRDGVRDLAQRIVALYVDAPRAVGLSARPPRAAAGSKLARSRRGAAQVFEVVGMSAPLDNFYQSLERTMGIRTDDASVTAATRARLVGVSVGELAQALRFSGLSIFTGHDAVVEIRRVDSTTQEGEK